MNWEQTIEFIRTNSEYDELVEKAYFDEKLHVNVERYRASEEFHEIIDYLKNLKPKASSILDLGSGNGISAVAFALEGYRVTSVEPDPSNTIGAGAIKKLIDHYNLENLTVYQGFAENMEFADKSFDIVFCRQCLHHASDIKRFTAESSRVLKDGGVFFSVRDHLVYDEADKLWFLQSHPLHVYYGGENAFTYSEYVSAIEQSDLRISHVLRHFDSPINYYPQTKTEIILIKLQHQEKLKSFARNKLKCFSKNKFLMSLAMIYLNRRTNLPLDESKIPGRLISFIARK